MIERIIRLKQLELVTLMASVAERKFMEELSILLQKNVTVQTASGKSYTGILSGVDANTMNICLSDARDETGQPIHKLFLNGQTVLQILSIEKPFDLRSLAERLERVFPRMVKTIEEAGVIVVMDKIRTVSYTHLTLPTNREV